MLEMHGSLPGADARLRERIATGSRVRLRDVSEGLEWEVAIVSSDEADPTADRISDVCPIGEALLGRRAGDEVRVEAPMGEARYRVMSVSFAPMALNGGHNGGALSPSNWEEP